MPHHPQSSRIQSVDALRGLVMIIMALDHVRDYFHSGAMLFQPEDLSRTTAALFFTRWITHLCAPVFAFTAGLGAFLWLSQGRTMVQLSRFLWKRGVWLVLLDLTAVRFAMFFSLTTGPVLLTVLWVLGWSMVLLGFLVRLSSRAIAAFSLAMILLHNLADQIRPEVLGAASWVWNFLHQPGAIPLDGTLVIIAYPLIPWVAVMAAGYCFGPVLRMDSRRRGSWLHWTGLSLTLAFLVIRLFNIYGDPQPWSPQKSPLFTLLSFLRTSKYPPSLDFLLMTLGPAMLIWAWLDRVGLNARNPLLVFGRVPLFYFIVHLFVIHALTYAFALVRYGEVGFLANPTPSMAGSAGLYPTNYGYDLPVVYLQWLLVVGIMYPMCLSFANLKSRRKSWWLNYM